MPTARSGPKAAHWKRLGLVEGAPECAIEAAWLHLIAEHHPDVGGDTNTARAINVARDELKGAGAKANEYVAAHYDSQPWLILGVDRSSSEGLAQRVGRQLSGELRRTHRRLAERVDWAMANFSRVTTPPPSSNGGRIRVTPPPPPPRPHPAAPRRPPQPASPGLPDGLPQRIDFGSVPWRADSDRTFKLTWKQFAPYEVNVDAPPPLTANVVSSKALPGRFAVTLAIEWDSDAFSHDPARRGYTLDDDVTLRWGGGGQALVKVRGILLFPAHVTVAPAELDLGTHDVDQSVTASLMVSATAPTTVTFETPAWLERTTADGHPVDTPLRLEANTGMRLEFAVRWPPILERAAPSFAAGRAVRPKGDITLRWDGGSIVVPAQMTVRPPKR